MFNDDDANEMANFGDRVPDGVIDASSYAQILCDIVDLMEDLDPDRFDKSMLFMMKCVNLAYEESEESSEFSRERAIDTITGLSYYIMKMFELISEDDKREFIRYQKEESLPATVDECQALPFYDMEDEVNNILNVFDQIAEGDYSNVTFITPDQAAEYGIDLSSDDET